LKVAYHLFHGLEMSLRGFRLGGAENAKSRIDIRTRADRGVFEAAKKARVAVSLPKLIASTNMFCSVLLLLNR
jgi:hypothetical protein